MSSITKLNKDIIYLNLINLPQIIFEVTDICNLNCKYCGLGELYDKCDVRERKMLPFENVKNILNFLLKIWQENHTPGVINPISISFYGGEPLLNMPLIKKIIKFLEESKNVGKKYFYSMTTNALTLDKHMDYIVEKDFRLLISLDGDKEGHSYRVDHSGNNSFERVYKNVKLLEAKYPFFFNRNVRFNSVLHNRNSNKSIQHFFKNNFNKTASVSPLNLTGIKKGKEAEINILSQTNDDNFCNHSDSHNHLNSKKDINPEESTALIQYIFNNGNVFDSYNDLFIVSSKKIKRATGTCLPFEKKMFITVNGKILPCERISHNFSYGKILKHSLEFDINNIIKTYNYYISKVNKQCKDCAAIKRCRQCIYKIDTLKDPHPYCNNFCSKEEIEKKDLKCIDLLRSNPEYYEFILNNISVR